MYKFFINGVRLPVTPSKMSTKISNNNKTINLINGEEINMLKTPGLSEISFDMLLPNTKYPFAFYENGFQGSKRFTDILENLKTTKQSFDFVVCKIKPSGESLAEVNMKVSLEEYTLEDDADNGVDMKVSVKLKQYRVYGTKAIPLDKPKPQPQPKRDQSTSPKPKAKVRTYKVVSGDCLWNIAKKFYGDGSLYPRIVNANKDKIINPNLIYPGQVFVIP